MTSLYSKSPLNGYTESTPSYVDLKNSDWVPSFQYITDEHKKIIDSSLSIINMEKDLDFDISQTPLQELFFKRSKKASLVEKATFFNIIHEYIIDKISSKISVIDNFLNGK